MVTESELRKLHLERISKDILFVLKTESPKTWLDLIAYFSEDEFNDIKKCLFKLLDENKVMLAVCEDRITALFYVKENPPIFHESR